MKKLGASNYSRVFLNSNVSPLNKHRDEYAEVKGTQQIATMYKNKSKTKPPVAAYSRWKVVAVATLMVVCMGNVVAALERTLRLVCPKKPIDNFPNTVPVGH